MFPVFILVIIFILGLSWGSFLNVVAYRSILDYSLFTRSFCCSCKAPIFPYDLIPILSFVNLKGSCRYCKSPISFLYPAIELLTGISFLLLFILVNINYWFAYIIFFSILIITCRMDAEFMLISETLTLGFIPAGLLFSFFNYLPISFSESAFGATMGYFILFIINKIFYFIRKEQAIGTGDFDLLALIGSFLGPLGVVYSLFIASILGSIIGVFLILKKQAVLASKLPFGPWLSMGAIIYALFSGFILIL